MAELTREQMEEIFRDAACGESFSEVCKRFSIPADIVHDDGSTNFSSVKIAMDVFQRQLGVKPS